MSSRFCPNCGSENVSEDKNAFICKDCDYEAKLFPQKELVGELAEEDFDDEDEYKELMLTKPVKATKKVVKKIVKKVLKKKTGRKKKL